MKVGIPKHISVKYHNLVSLLLCVWCFVLMQKVHSRSIERNSSYIIVMQQWRIQDFPEEGAPTPQGGTPTYDFAKISPKLHKIERIWGPGGGVVPCTPLRCAIVQLCHCMYTSKGQLIADKGKHYIPLTLLLRKSNTPFVPLKANRTIFHIKIVVVNKLHKKSNLQ